MSLLLVSGGNEGDEDPDDDTGNGVTETPVTEDTTGTEATDWISTDTSGITIDGAGGDDRIDAAGADLTVLGGAGDDEIQVTGPEGSGGADIDGGMGDDFVSAEFDATVQGGAGDDSILIDGGEAYGGEGNDFVSNFGSTAVELYGGAGNDDVIVSGEGAVGYGDEGDDFITTDNGAVGYGGEGNDQLQPASGTTVDGGAGDDLFTISNDFYDEDGPATVTTGEGEDTIDVRMMNAYDGEADQIYLQVTDFDPTEDILQIGAISADYYVDSFEIVEADDGTHTDVLVTYINSGDSEPGIAVIRIAGTIGLSADQVVVTS